MNTNNSKYLQISQDIIERIMNGELAPGDRVPSEHELMQQYGVSNTTARKSLLNIELKGWVIRIKGKGTFVLNRSKDILMEKTVIENGISTNVNGQVFSIDGPVLKYRRLRYANDILMKDDTRYISMTACRNIHLIEPTQPLIRIYEEKYKLQIENVHRTIGTMVLYPESNDNYFENEIPLSVFILNGVCIAQEGSAIEIEYSLYRGDKYQFSVDAKPQLVNIKS